LYFDLIGIKIISNNECEIKKCFLTGSWVCWKEATTTGESIVTQRRKES